MTASSQTLQRPDEFLDQLLECLVIAFEYRKEEGALTFIADHPEKVAGADRTFVALLFRNVTRFERELGNAQHYAKYETQFRLQDGVSPIVVQSAKRIERGTTSVLSCWFGPAFGGFEVEFSQLAGFVRRARSVRHGESFAYVDATTGDEIDFFDPFPEMR